MADDRLTIDPATIEDNIGEQQVEFVAEASGDDYQFAVKYAVLEALSAEDPASGAVALFDSNLDEIMDAAAVALGRDQDADMIVIGESDIG